MAGYDNLPDGMTGGEDYLNPPSEVCECTECYADLEPEWRFCPHCGAEQVRSAYDCARDWEVDRAIERMGV